MGAIQTRYSVPKHRGTKNAVCSCHKFSPSQCLHSSQNPKSTSTTLDKHSCTLIPLIPCSLIPPLAQLLGTWWLLPLCKQHWIYALQYISHWQKPRGPRGNANAAPAFAPAEATGMEARDFWYQSEIRCEHSSAGWTVGCLPGTWEALGCLMWEPWSLWTELSLYRLHLCSFVQVLLCFTAQQLSAERTFELASCKAASHAGLWIFCDSQFEHRMASCSPVLQKVVLCQKTAISGEKVKKWGNEV